MFRRGLSRPVPLLFAALLMVLLAVLATLQHRWIGEVSQMQRHRLHFNLFSAGSRFADDFDQEVTQAWHFFLPAPREGGAWPEDLTERMELWRAEAAYPRLVRDIVRIRRTPDGDLGAEVLRPGARGFEAVSWPADLEPLRGRLARGPHRGHLMPVLPEVPALVITAFPMHRRAAGERLQALHPPAGEILLLRLDERAITGEILPALTRRHFGEPQEREYAVAVVAADDPGRVIFQSDPGLSPAALRSGGDASLPLFTLLPFKEPHLLQMRAFGPAPGPAAGPHRREAGAWRLVLIRRHGTLEHAVAHFRYKNVALSGGIMLLLAVAAAMMMVTSQRVQKLARQQIELVAGVTHELHTPITAIRSAGQNLADGVVADPLQVKRYGTLIETEGRRLSRMVGQMLELAGLQSGQATYTLRPTEVGEALDGALDDCRWLLEERQVRIEKDIDPALPAVLGDAGALRRALRNLVENAAKYGGRSPWIGVRARAAGREVAVTVEDRGPGIRREDLPRLFEPFYRGREVKTGGIPGSGLGLSVVRRIAEAHRGRVSVSAGGSGQGAAFTLHLPIAPEEAA
ncbi:MAG TPA: HAMP domain-containing sensor histidine kinase [Thermoanaerobaculia bacterium]|nr:HAMP domain-containing sensor histidine kinase [Thermoanaerobaculia bacterium]